VLRQSRKKPVTLRLEARQIQRAKQLARAKSLSYQALLRNWISEGIAREEQVVERA
jgi:predicted DNA binding CopG/RHH family protein